MKKIFTYITIALMVFSLCACGSQVKNSSAAYGAPDVYEAAAEESGLYPLTGGSQSNSFRNDAAEQWVMDEESAAEPSPEQSLEERTDKIIYSADVTVESLEFDKAVETLSKLIEENGGYLQSSSISGANYSTLSSGSKYSRYANYIIRVPAENFDKLMTSFSSIGNVPNSSVYSENVSSQYYDTQMRLDNYKAQQQRLVELLDKAETVSDVIEIENELTEIMYKIESLQTSLNSWDKQVAYSTIYLNLKEVYEYTPDEGESFFSQLGQAFVGGLVILKEFIIGLISILPVLVVIAAIAFGVVKLIKKIKRTSKANKNVKKTSSDDKSN